MSTVSRLEAWLAREQAVQARVSAGAGVGVSRPEQVAGKGGLELMQAMLRGELPCPSIAKTLDFQPMEVAEGRAVFQGRPGPTFESAHGFAELPSQSRA